MPLNEHRNMRKFAEACDRVADTTKKLEKTAIVADYLRSIPLEEASVAAIFLSGKPFPTCEETTLQVGGRLLWQALEDLSGKSAQDLAASYRKHGDLGAAAVEVLPTTSVGTGALAGPGRAKLGSEQGHENSAVTDGLNLREVQSTFRKIAAARGPAPKNILVRELLSQVTPLESK